MTERDPRMTAPTLRVLKFYLMAPSTERSGAEISKATKVGAGTLYPMLARLEEAGWFNSDWEKVDPKDVGRPRRRFYRLTGLGETRARAALSEFQMPMVEGGEVWAS